MIRWRIIRMRYMHVRQVILTVKAAYQYAVGILMPERPCSTALTRWQAAQAHSSS